MTNMNPSADVPGGKTRIEQAEARTEQAETRTEQAKTRIEQAETRTELAKTRTEQAETRTEQAETRTEHAEAALEQKVERDKSQNQATLPERLKYSPNDPATSANPIAGLNDQQRKILQFIAAGQNTKQIAEILKISPKTVEYHRMKLMDSLNVHDIPGLVRLALRVGLVPQEN